mmetsp:Transcript_31718/g.44201  ORF Transcript_31718/g.44201 Transcript_31718/m.44201 type:complete len:221 (-) Transcript_31718:865-1527(-)
MRPAFRVLLNKALIHERKQLLRNDNTLLRLEVLEDAAYHPRRRAQSRVQHVHVALLLEAAPLLALLILALLLGGLSAANLHSAGLVVEAVGARHQLAHPWVRFLLLFVDGLIAREPCLKIVFLSCRVVQLARADVDYLVREAKGLCERLSLRDHLVVHLPRVLRMAHAKLLDLLELMHTEDAPVVDAGLARLFPEAGACPSVKHRVSFELLIVEPFIRVI